MPQFAELSHTRTAYEVAGDGPPVLLVHGAEGTRASFTALTALLGQHATVINYDQRDCGETQTRRHGHSSLAEVARDAAELIEHLGFSSVSVLGVSLGGRVAQTLAILYPERVHDLMLCNTWPVDAWIQDLNPDIRLLRELTDGLPDSARELATMYYPPSYVDAHPVVVERIIARSAFPGRVARRALGAERPSTPLSMLRVPTLLISGEEDRIVPTRIMRDMADTIADSELVTMPGVGHSPAVQVPRQTADLISARIASRPAPGRRG